jgi:hypothetical protein
MNKSQVRRLARDYASGRLAHDEYVAMRGALIDAIVTGETAIASSAESAADPATAQPPERRIPAAPVPLIIAALAVIVIVWMFLSSQQTTAPGSGRHGEVDPVPGLRVTGARVLVKDFLATRDWSRESLAEFRDLWNALTPNEQAEARAAPWFRRLAEALREEINAHKALAEFDGSGLSTTTGRRLSAFGELLGIAWEIPDSEVPAPAAPDHGDALPAGEQKSLSGSQWPIDNLRAELRGGQRENATVTANPATQPPPVYTLQVFASSSRENVDRLVARYQALDLRVHVNGADLTPFRVLYGRFDSRQAAEEASVRLPATMLEEVGKPLLRDIADFN